MRRHWVLLAPLFTFACTPDYDLEKRVEESDGGPAIEVTPTDIYFGTAEAGTALAEAFTITSVGETTLTVTEVLLDAPEAFEITSFTAGRLLPGESMDVVITYTSTGGEDIGEANVVSDDPESPSIVNLNGGGLVPELTIDPDSYDYGYVAAGVSEDAEIVLRNTGGATLTIDALASTESVFAYELGDSLPIVLEPGEESTVTVTFSPPDGEIYTGQLQVESDDPEGMKYATLNGSGAVDQPIAVCEANPGEAAPLERVAWIGSGSYDPSGAEITAWVWELVTQPSGSAAAMPSGTGANRNGFTPDLAGTYEAELIVQNEHGEWSEPCTAVLETVPGEDLWIEMFWTHSGDDMDLHLLKPAGSLESTGDCYYANCTYGGLDWGTRGDSSDDPALDLDDISATGPENINIDEPASGVYSVYVHDYPGSVYNGQNDVTVNIYIGGALVWTDTRDVDEEDYYEPFAEIDWSSGSGTVTAL